MSTDADPVAEVWAHTLENTPRRKPRTAAAKRNRTQASQRKYRERLRLIRKTFALVEQGHLLLPATVNEALKARTATLKRIGLAAIDLAQTWRLEPAELVTIAGGPARLLELVARAEHDPSVLNPLEERVMVHRLGGVTGGREAEELKAKARAAAADAAMLRELDVAGGHDHEEIAELIPDPEHEAAAERMSRAVREANRSAVDTGFTVDAPAPAQSPPPAAARPVWNARAEMLVRATPLEPEDLASLKPEEVEARLQRLVSIDPVSLDPSTRSTLNAEFHALRRRLQGERPTP